MTVMYLYVMQHASTINAHNKILLIVHDDKELSFIEEYKRKTSNTLRGVRITILGVIHNGKTKPEHNTRKS